jgi:hypothetical protein
MYVRFLPNREPSLPVACQQLDWHRGIPKKCRGGRRGLRQRCLTGIIASATRKCLPGGSVVEKPLLTPALKREAAPASQDASSPNLRSAGGTGFQVDRKSLAPTSRDRLDRGS